MRTLFRILYAISAAVIVRNLDNVIDALGLRTLYQKLGVLGSALDQFVLNKWTLAAATAIVGFGVADWFVRKSLHFEVAPGRWPLAWLRHRRWLLIKALRSPRTIGRILDVPFALATFEKALTESRGFPPLPTIDPESPRISETTDYLMVIGDLHEHRLDEARRRASVISPPDARTRSVAKKPRSPRPGTNANRTGRKTRDPLRR